MLCSEEDGWRRACVCVSTLLLYNHEQGDFQRAVNGGL